MSISLHVEQTVGSFCSFFSCRPCLENLKKQNKTKQNPKHREKKKIPEQAPLLLPSCGSSAAPAAARRPYTRRRRRSPCSAERSPAAPWRSCGARAGAGERIPCRAPEGAPPPDRNMHARQTHTKQQQKTRNRAPSFGRCAIRRAHIMAQTCDTSCTNHGTNTQHGAEISPETGSCGYLRRFLFVVALFRGDTSLDINPNDRPPSPSPRPTPLHPQRCGYGRNVRSFVTTIVTRR